MSNDPQHDLRFILAIESIAESLERIARLLGARAHGQADESGDGGTS